MANPILPYLEPAAILLGAEAKTSEEVIGLLAERLQSGGRVHPSYRAAVIEREAQMPTGLPLGAINVAIPHTDMHHVVSPAIALAVLREPVAFASMDEPTELLDVRIVFALALTDKTAQIEMLQAIMGFIQDEAALARLAAARTPDEAIDAIAG